MEVFRYRPTALRFFLAWCWVSVTAGILLYLLTFLFDYPFRLALFFVIGRAFVQTLIRDMDRYSVSFSPTDVTGPSLYGGLITIPICEISWKASKIRNGRFFIESQDGGIITGRLFWYKPDGQLAIDHFVSQIQTPRRKRLASGTFPATV